MNQKQREKWEKTRSKGMWRFVLLYTVLVSSAMIVATTVIFSSRYWLLNAFFYVVSGFIGVIALWHYGEYKYRKTSSSV